MAQEPPRRLGRGLDALLQDYAVPDAAPAQASEAPRTPLTALLASIHPNPRNPRRDFSGEELEDLAASIRAHGLVQPVVVRPKPDTPGEYEIIAGERRWRASQMAGIHEVPITVLEVSDREALELAIVENVQRSDLNPLEEAQGYQALIQEFSYSQGDLADVIGKSRVHVTNTLRLLKLPEKVLEHLRFGRLTAGHARALINTEEPVKLADIAIAKGLSVRDTEKLAQRGAEPSGGTARQADEKDADTIALEREIGDRLGIKVDIRHRPDGRGEVRLKYRDLDQLDAVCNRLRA
ncbi:ParB/RepB/Spo0J family partition protein [Afifella sp. IM 167]|uniref:ParB/RepB/Spo0J family partition protein n=1 Tax=Afifella sp. IM 167 TaxID=2033586 RepID=UPI001CCE109C|nr:ParB/RepB/Spo0J family partition protein [Afifella sp. IM 167]MBZ8135064.1 chromosome partitioning protein ParB [Afifella sp. IM 167]